MYRHSRNARVSPRELVRIEDIGQLALPVADPPAGKAEILGGAEVFEGYTRGGVCAIALGREDDDADVGVGEVGGLEESREEEFD